MTIPFVNFWGDSAIPMTWQPKSVSMTWFCTDTEESYKQKQNNVFTPESFGYNFNKYGYRIGSRDWDLNTTRQRILTLGCSHTVGVGVPWEHAWSTMFADYVGGEFFNLGIAGASSDTVFRTLLQTIDIIKPDIVAIYWPDPIRWEFYETFQWDSTGAACDIPHFNSVWNVEAGSFNESHLINLFNRNVKSVKLLQRLYGFKLVEVFSEKFTLEYLDNHLHINEAYSFDSRDLVHPGITMQESIKNKFIDIYSNL